jgi:hypothetical protein
VQPHSLLHTFPFFKRRGFVLWIQFVPATDCHFECVPSNFERSHTGLPYPRLGKFAQSLLDTNSLVALTDLVDGMDLSEEWGEKHLDLDGTNDTAWARQKNEAIKTSAPSSGVFSLFELSEAPFNGKETWSKITGGKRKRIGPELPSELYATRFRLKNSQDPRLN